LQEAKGGGLAEAFGGLGAQTFGVKASGINKFTAYVAVVFILSAILITCVRKSASVVGDFGAPEGSMPPVEGAPAPETSGGSGPGSTEGE
jgi:preprotein translocase subunit SecG